ncbi:MAG: radical SAM protein, partial [Oscillospiraceae bacterium]|nr:radical SAM protein [Oscillospiraceae bacterium]
ETFQSLVLQGNTFVQLSGGEPTVRDDLPEIIRAAREVGCETVQLNSNGLRLAREPQFTRALAEAGLSFVFMQFDGVSELPHKTLRGAPLLGEKLRAIEVCDANNLGVTLVPTIVPGVNDGEIGAILNLAIARAPAVRGVHFQPVSYFGRYPAPPRDEDRITLPELLRAIETQTAGKIKISDFVPSSCDHPRCGFHGDFAVLPQGALLRLTPKYKPGQCCDGGDAHLQNRKFVARRWTRPNAKTVSETQNNADFGDMTTFLNRVKSHGFTITAMAFQDAWTLDLERLRRCSLHVVSGARTVPFCARYITAV